jgi:hypothetical protein
VGAAGGAISAGGPEGLESVEEEAGSDVTASAWSELASDEEI